jgi:hypothetical protein
MVWKPEYAERRRQRAKTDLEYRAKRNEQSATDKERRAEYMREYRRNNLDKWKRSPEQQDEVNARRRERYAVDAEYREHAKAVARKRTPEQRREQLLRTKYKLTPAEYDELLRMQDGSCAICRRGNNGKRFHVDHCHDGGHVRGLLCSPCNTGIGHFQDNTDRPARAIEYIREARAMGGVVPTK